MFKSEEASLLSIIKSGDESKIDEAFERIYNNYVKIVAFSIGKYINDTDLIKELTNEVFLKFFANVNNINNSIKYYLLTTARNLAFDYLKKYKLLDFYDDDTYFDYGLADSDITYQLLIEDLRKILSEKEIKIIILHSIDGFTFKEIGNKMKISDKAATATYLRAIKKYRNFRKEIYE